MEIEKQKRAFLNRPEQSKIELIEASKVEEAEFRSIIPPVGFFGNYMKYTDRQDGPGSFHFWSAVTIMGAVLQRRAWINRGIYELFPNFYTVLVAPSGVCRKTRVINIATELIEKYEWMNMIADKTTPEALLQALMEGSKAMERGADEPATMINIQMDHTGFVRAPELAVFLSKETYTSGMVTILTDLYDCKDNFKYLTRNKKPIVLTNTAVSLLGGSTPEWLATQLPATAFEGGFMSRIIFVVKHYRDRMIAWPTRPEKGETEAIQQKIINIRRQFRGEIPISHDAREWFTGFYEELAVSPTQEYHLTGFFERKPDTVLKLALLLSASEAPEKKLVNLGHMIQAEKIITWTQNRMFRAFEHIDLSPTGVIRNKILEFVTQAGEVSRRDVLRRFGGRLSSVKDLEEIEKMMVESGDLEVIHKVQPKGKPGRPAIIYKPKSKEDEE